MIKLKLLAFVLFLLGPCAFLTRRGWRFGRALSASVCAQSLALVFLGYFLPFSVSAGILAAVSAAAWIAAAVQTRDWKKACVSLVLPCLAALVCLIGLYDACAARQFLSYDEYSHWGMMVKAIHAFDALPRMGEGAAYIQYTYPPSGAMMPALACTLLGYRDGIAYLGYAVLIAGLLLGLAAKAGKGAPAIVPLYLCMTAIFPLSILRLFIEPVAALLMALLMMGAWNEQETCTWEDALYALMLAMCKSTGLVFLAAALFVRLFAQRSRAQLKKSGCLLAAGLIGTASYAIYCRVHGIAAVISPSYLAENLRALREGTLDAAYAGLPGRFLDFFLFDPLPQSGVYSSYGFATSAVVMAVLLALCAVHVCLAENRKQALRLWTDVWIANIAYILMIVASYFIGFSPAEVQRLAEADRYTMLVALWTGLLVTALLAHEAGRRPAGRKAALLCAAAALWLPLSHPEMTVSTFVTKAYIDDTQWARDPVSADAQQIASRLGGQTDARILCMGEYPYIETHFLLCGRADIGRADEMWGSAPWSGDCQQVEKALETGAYSHVYVGGLMQEDANLAIDGRYACLTKDQSGLKAHTLYRVERGEDIALVDMETMNGQEP